MQHNNEELEGLLEMASCREVFFAEGHTYIRTSPEHVEEFIAQLVLFDLPLQTLQDSAKRLPPARPMSSPLFLPPTLVCQLLIGERIDQLTQRSVYLHWLVLLALRWSLLPSPAKMYWADTLCANLPQNDALALGILIALTAMPHSPVADRLAWNHCSHLCNADFESLQIKPTFPAVHCFWLGLGFAFDQPRGIFLSHRGTESKMDLVVAINQMGLNDWVFLDCLTRPSTTDHNQLFLWQNLWACSRFLVVESPNFFESKWCEWEIAAFEVIEQIFPKTRSISRWPWHGLPIGSDLACSYYANKLSGEIEVLKRDPIVQDKMTMGHLSHRLVPEESREQTQRQLTAFGGAAAVRRNVIALFADTDEAVQQLVARFLEKGSLDLAVLERMHALRSLLPGSSSLGINITVPMPQLEMLIEASIIGLPPRTVFGGKVLPGPFGVALLLQDLDQDFSWMLALLPMPVHARCFVGQLRSALVVDQSVQGFKLGAIPCLTASSESELVKLVAQDTSALHTKKFAFDERERSWMNQYEEVSEEELKAARSVEQVFICDICQRKMYQKRYQCQQCRNFHLCEKCWKEDAHPFDHPIEEAGPEESPEHMKVTLEFPLLTKGIKFG